MDSFLNDRYHYQETLGNKAGRTTILAQDSQSGQRVVIKLLTFSDEFHWEDLRLFERETATLRSLDHPAIPRYLDSFEMDSAQGKSLALVQSYIPAKSLAEYLQAGRQFSQGEVRELLNALLDILNYLHDRHPPVIHRDIKPSNILLGDRSGNKIGQVYLVDFGSVQTLATRGGQTITVVGTYGYMPPEQFGGTALPASDIYSLGCTALNLITGSHPADLPQRDLQIQFAQVVELSPSLVQWLQKATHPSIEQRFPHATIAKEVLHQSSIIDQKSSFLSPRKPRTKWLLFWDFLWRNTFMGTLTGAVYGGIFGTAVYPILGTIFGAQAGGIVGFPLGLINGIISAFFTYFLPTQKKYYPHWIGLIGFGWCFLCFGSVPVFAYMPGMPVALIASLSMGLSSYYIARWYQKQIG